MRLGSPLSHPSGGTSVFGPTESHLFPQVAPREFGERTRQRPREPLDVRVWDWVSVESLKISREQDPVRAHPKIADITKEVLNPFWAEVLAE